MTLTITIPNIKNPRTVKDAVISTLTKEWPLSARKLHNSVRNLGVTATYQAVHKALRELERDDIVARTGKEYRINEKWIDGIMRFGKDTKKAYASGAANNGNGSDVTNLTFNSMYEVDGFLGEFAKGCDFKPGESIICIHWNHYWVPLFLDKEMYAQFKGLASVTKMYSVTPSDTPIDRWCYEFWKKTPLHPKIVPESPNTDFIVFDDIVIQIFYPEFLRKELDRIFSSAKTIDELDVDALFKNIFQRKVIIPVTVNRNPVLAEQLRNQILEYFKQ